MTIIGFEKRTDGTANLLVFDPMFRDSAEIIKLVGKKFTPKNPSDLLRAYRRSARYLRKYNEFEVMKQVNRTVIWLSYSDCLRLTPPDRSTKWLAEQRWKLMRRQRYCRTWVEISKGSDYLLYTWICIASHYIVLGGDHPNWERGRPGKLSSILVSEKGWL